MGREVRVRSERKEDFGVEETLGGVRGVRDFLGIRVRRKIRIIRKKERRIIEVKGAGFFFFIKKIIL